MIDTKEEYNSLLKHLKNLNKKKKLSKHLQSKLEGLEEVEQLINFVIPVSSLKLRDIEFMSFDAWVTKYYINTLGGYTDKETQEFKTEKQLSQIYRDNNINP